MSYKPKVLEVAAGGTGLSSTTANQLLYSSATNTIAGLATANNGVLVTSNAGVPSLLPNGTSGNVLTAVSGAPPAWSSPTTISTFTPALNFGGATTGITYANLGGSYVKVGSLVFINIFITLSSKGSATGNATITGLPFPANGTAFRSLFNLQFDFGFNAYPASTTLPLAFVNLSTSTIVLSANASGVAAVNITDATFQNGTQFMISGSYFT